MKKTLAIIIAVAMLLTQLAVGSFAFDDIFGQDFSEMALKAESITAVAQKPLIENADGWVTYDYDEDGNEFEYFEYDIYCAEPIFTITFKDGEVITGTDEEIGEATGEYTIPVGDQFADPWEIGTNTAVVGYGMLECEFEVEVLENPIESISAVAQKELVEGWDSFLMEHDEDGSVYENYNVSAADVLITVKYKDGTELVGNFEKLYEETGYYVSFNDDQCNNPWSYGENTASVDFMGHNAEFTVVVIENPYTSATISGEKELVVSFNTDNPEESYNSRAAQIFIYSNYEGCMECAIMLEDGRLFENVQVFFAYDAETDTVDYAKDVSLYIGGFETNTLDHNEWVKACITFDNMAYGVAGELAYNEYYLGNTFDGFDIAAGEYSVDELVEISTYICEWECAETDDENLYYELPVETVAANIEAIFGITDVDLTTASGYNAESNTISVAENYSLNIFYEVASVEYTEDGWTGTVSFTVYVDEIPEYRTFEIYLDDNFTLSKVVCETEEELPVGDVNGDGKVSAMDARWILQSSTQIRTLTDEEALRADLSGDGKVSAIDARYILQISVGIR